MKRLATFLLACAAWAAQAATAVSDDRGHVLQLARPPQRIVSLLPSLTETVCELQACERLVGVDRHSNWPPSLRRLPRLGGMEDAQVERIVALAPDLVLAALSTRAVERLEALGLPVLALEPRSLRDTRSTIERIALALGRPQDGQTLWQRIDARIDAAAARVPPALRGQRVYFEVAAVPFAAGEASFIGELLARLGMGNIVGADLGPFPQLNPEFVVRAQPEVVMATAVAVHQMPGRPGWGRLRALRNGHHCGFAAQSYDLLMRPGPRLGEAADVLADCLNTVATQPR